LTQSTLQLGLSVDKNAASIVAANCNRGRRSDYATQMMREHRTVENGENVQNRCKRRKPIDVITIYDVIILYMQIYIHIYIYNNQVLATQ